MFNLQPVTTTIVTLVPPPTQEVGVLDVLVGALGLTGVIVIGSVLLGGALGGALIGFKRWQDRRRGDAPDEPTAARLDLSSR